jgi:hypothetical protein
VYPPEINRLTVKNRIIVKMIMRPSFSWMRVPRGSSQRGKSSSNPTAFTDFARYHSARCKTPVFWQPCATGKTTRFSPHDAMHRVAWALQSSKAIGQKCEKPWENHVSGKWKVERSCGQERTGTEQPTNPLGNSHFDTTRDAKYDARRETGSARDSARATDSGFK